MWILSCVMSDDIYSVITTLVFMSINMWLLVKLFCGTGVTNLPSMFLASTFWFAMSSPLLHTCWQGHLTALGALLSCLILIRINYQKEATEELFLATLIWSITSISLALLVSGILLMWIYLLINHKFTLRVWLASLVAVAIYFIFAIILHHFGWLPFIWKDNIILMSLKSWLIIAGMYIATIVITYIPLKKDSLGGGIVYLLYMIGLAIIDIFLYVNN